MDSEGSRRLILAAAQAGGLAVKEREFTAEDRKQRSERAKQADQDKNCPWHNQIGTDCTLRNPWKPVQ
jgi:hypothetical protein